MECKTIDCKRDAQGSVFHHTEYNDLCYSCRAYAKDHLSVFYFLNDVIIKLNNRITLLEDELTKLKK